MIIKRGGRKLVRNKAQLELLNLRLSRLQSRDVPAQGKHNDSFDDKDYYMEAIWNRGGRFDNHVD